MGEKDTILLQQILKNQDEARDRDTEILVSIAEMKKDIEKSINFVDDHPNPCPYKKKHSLGIQTLKVATIALLVKMADFAFMLVRSL